MKDGVSVGDLLAELDVVESRLDPRPARRGTMIADLVVLLIIAFLTLGLDLQLLYPSLLVLFLFVARGVVAVVRAWRDHDDRVRRDELLKALQDQEA